MGVLLLHLSGREKEENGPQEGADTINLTQPEFWCWYLKVNERLYNLKQIEPYLRTIAKQYSKENAVDIFPEHELTGKVAKCEECNSEIVILEADTD